MDVRDGAGCGLVGGLTSACQERLDPDMCITDTQQEDLGVPVQLDVVVPEVAHELLDPDLEIPLSHPGDEWFVLLSSQH